MKTTKVIELLFDEYGEKLQFEIPDKVSLFYLEEFLGVEGIWSTDFIQSEVTLFGRVRFFHLQRNKTLHSFYHSTDSSCCTAMGYKDITHVINLTNEEWVCYSIKKEIYGK